MRRILLLSLLSGLLAGQQPEPVQPQSAPTTIRTTVDVVVAPVLVFDRDGQYVSGLQPEQFHFGTA